MCIRDSNTIIKIRQNLRMAKLLSNVSWNLEHVKIVKV